MPPPGYAMDSMQIGVDREQELARMDLAEKVRETKDVLSDCEPELLMQVLAIWIPNITIKQLVNELI